MSILSKLRKPATLAGGIPIHLPEQLTLAHEHARVATRDFRVGFVEWPGVNAISPGLTVVRAGQLIDDRSAVARHAPKGALRRPTKAEVQARSVETPGPAPTEEAEVVAVTEPATTDRPPATSRTTDAPPDPPGGGAARPRTLL